MNETDSVRFMFTRTRGIAQTSDINSFLPLQGFVASSCNELIGMLNRVLTWQPPSWMCPYVPDCCLEKLVSLGEVTFFQMRICYFY
jgi:hypothetical protein